MEQQSKMQELNANEQTALFRLCSHLLDLDWPVSTDNQSRLTLLWLDWRDRWLESTTSTPEVGISTLADPEHLEDDRARARAEQPPEVDQQTAAAIITLRGSPCHIEILRFLQQLAQENGLNQKEEIFLRYVKEQLEGSFSKGVYR